MNQPGGQQPIDPALIEQLSNDFQTLSRDMARVGMTLATLRGQLSTPPPAVPASLPPPPVPTPAPPPQVWRPPPPYAWQPPAQAPAPPKPPKPPSDPWWQKEGMISKVLAVAGTVVTLIGVAMLLVLAAQAGFFGPIPRVIGGALLAVALVAAGIRIRGVALAATGIAAGYLNVLAVTEIYRWLSPEIGLALAAGITVIGVGLAARWRAQSLALLVVIPAAVLAPVVTDGITVTLIAFLLVLQIGCAPVQLLQSWPALHAARTGPVVIALIVAVIAAHDDSADRFRLLVAAIVAAVAGIGSAVATTRRWPDEIAASASLGVAAIPLLLTPSMFNRTTGIIIELSLAAAMILVAALPMLVPHLRLTGLVASAPALLAACFTVTDKGSYAIPLLVVAVGYLASARQTQSTIGYGIGLACGALGAMTFLIAAPPDTLTDAGAAVRMLGGPVVIASVLGLIFCGMALWRTGIQRVWWIIAGIAALYVATTGIVAAAVAIAGRDGFIGGHTIATITWMLTAAAILLAGLRNPAYATIAAGSGLTLATAAVAKLFGFDLATLNGIARVAAFIAVGLLLLAVGTRYARALGGGSPGPPGR